MVNSERDQSYLPEQKNFLFLKSLTQVLNLLIFNLSKQQSRHDVTNQNPMLISGSHLSDLEFIFHTGTK
jgi:hypothetical protein